MGLLDRLKFKLPEFSVREIWDEIVSSPKEEVSKVGGYQQTLRFGYYLSKWTKYSVKLENYSDTFSSGKIIEKCLQTFGVKSSWLPKFKVKVDVKGAVFEVIDKPYEEIIGAKGAKYPPEIDFPLSENTVAELDRDMTEKPIDVDVDGTPEIPFSLFRIDFDDKPEKFHLLCSKPKKHVRSTGVNFSEIGLHLFITPSADPEKTIHISLPASIYVYLDV